MWRGEGESVYTTTTVWCAVCKHTPHIGHTLATPVCILLLLYGVLYEGTPLGHSKECSLYVSSKQPLPLSTPVCRERESEREKEKEKERAHARGRERERERERETESEREKRASERETTERYMSLYSDIDIEDHALVGARLVTGGVSVSVSGVYWS
jgi:hypothetical protein